MKIENQVCTLEQAKRLNELGAKQQSYFIWTETSNSEPYLTQTPFGKATPPLEYSAFTVAELGVMLPEEYSSFHISKSWHNRKAEFGCERNDNITPSEVMQADTEAQARAAMLIYLLENNHITATEINARL